MAFATPTQLRVTMTDHSGFDGVGQSCVDSDVLSHCSSSDHGSDDTEYFHSGNYPVVPVELLSTVYDLLGMPLVIFHCPGLQTLPRDAALPVEHIFANKGWWSLMGDTSLQEFVERSNKIVYSAFMTRAFRRILYKTQELGRHITRYRWTFRPGGVAAKCGSFQLVLNASPVGISYSDGTIKRCMMQQVACIEPTTDFSVPDHLGNVGISSNRERSARAIPTVPEAHSPQHRPVQKSMSLEQEDGDSDHSDDEVCEGPFSLGHTRRRVVALPRAHDAMARLHATIRDVDIGHIVLSIIWD
eukprot:m.787327 g.787327  ORF g.787327 m.787327 type:complete len:300 (+) comp23308_c0_seq9:537-1436(+)